MEIKVRVSSRADFEQKGPKSYLGKKAPPLFILARNGNSMNLTDREGKKPLLISIWATWCPACKQALPNLKMLQDKFGGKIEIALITNEPYTLTDEFAKANKAFASISTLNHQVDEGKLHIAYWVDALPTFLILDRQSRLVTVIDGYDPREIQAAVEKAAI
jgi:thiol-disulfide isomerase/thioredoxin